jgi:uncharacterized protein YbbK (DUF523 family)
VDLDWQSACGAMRTDRHERLSPPSPQAGARLPPILVGVSACLLGEPVRYDGTDQRDAYVCGALARQFRLVPICPEVELGLGVPRRPIRLVRTERGVRVRDARDPDNPKLDFTEQFRVLAEELAPLLGRLSGYVFKSGSPSCGVRDVKLYEQDGRCRPVATGEFARLVMALYPRLPVVDERQLSDPQQRRRFLRRVSALGGSGSGH